MFPDCLERPSGFVRQLSHGIDVSRLRFVGRTGSRARADQVAQRRLGVVEPTTVGVPAEICFTRSIGPCRPNERSNTLPLKGAMDRHYDAVVFDAGGTPLPELFAV
jgi:hypothetical protein